MVYTRMLARVSPSTVIAAGCLAILIFDVLGAMASRWLRFQYSRLAPGSYIIYTATSVIAARSGPAWLGIVAGATVAVMEATIGWSLSWWIGPGRPSAPTSLSGARMLRIVALVTMMGMGFGLVGTLVAALTQ